MVEHEVVGGVIAVMISVIVVVIASRKRNSNDLRDLEGLTRQPCRLTISLLRALVNHCVLAKVF